MTTHKSDSPGITESWDTYWQGARHGSAFTGGRSSHPVIMSFWDEVFAAARSRYAAPRIIDIASGNGALVERATAALGKDMQLTCLDISAAAIRGLQRRFADVQGIVADARSMPLQSASYDVAVSQFGIEYAGLDAMTEVARLVASGGRLAMLLHHRGGGIYRQCALNLEAINAMRDARFLPLAMAVFEAGFAACRGSDRVRYENAAGEMLPAVRSMESIMRKYGPHVADDTILKLYQDVKVMHERIRHYEPSEVLDWLSRMQDEADAYAGRMASMCNAAIDAEQFAAACGELRNAGFALLRSGPLVNPERDIPLAWELIAGRP